MPLNRVDRLCHDRELAPGMSRQVFAISSPPGAAGAAATAIASRMLVLPAPFRPTSTLTRRKSSIEKPSIPRNPSIAILRNIFQRLSGSGPGLQGGHTRSRRVASDWRASAPTTTPKAPQKPLVPQGALMILPFSAAFASGSKQSAKSYSGYRLGAAGAICGWVSRPDHRLDRSPPPHLHIQSLDFDVNSRIRSDRFSNFVAIT